PIPLGSLSANQLSGSLPSSISRFTALHSLLAACNRMSGSIPAGLASLTALQELDVSWSGLSGTVPALLRAAALSLQVQLSGNALSGSVPPSLPDLPTSCFRPGNPRLCGKPMPDCKKRSSKPRKDRVAFQSSLPVPSRLALVALLALIALLRQAEAYSELPPPEGCVAEIAEVDREAMCAVYAALPEGVFLWHDGMMPPLRMFDEHGNVTYCCVMPRPKEDESSWCDLSCPLECTPAGRITSIYSDPSRIATSGPGGSGGSCPQGALSPAIGDLGELSALVFRHSCLADDLPDSVTRLQKLTIFEMPENNFSGPIPPGLFRLLALRAVDLGTLEIEYPEFQLQFEGLSGSLPDGPDAYSPSLEAEILSGNALSGELPRALLRAPALRRLDLQSNNITGELPGETGAYSWSITALNLRNNSLSGAIPPTLAEMTALRKLDLGGNRLSGAVPAALRDSESLKALDEVRFDNNTLTGPFCDALLPARELWLGFNDLGGASAGSSPSATGGGDGDGAHALSWVYPHGPEPQQPLGQPESFHGASVREFDLSHNNFSGGIPGAYFTDKFSRVDLRFNDLRGPLFNARWDSRSRVWSHDWDALRVSNNSARMVGAVGAGYLPAPAPGVQASAAESAALLAVRDALLGEAAGGAAGGAAGIAGLVNGGNGSWAEILRSWDASSSSACACGSLSEALGQLTQLTSLRVSGHALSGGLLPSLSRLSHLVALDLSSNRHLSGSIPPALFALPSLRELSLRGNNLTGEVLPSTTAAAAAEVAALSRSLESLDVGGNALSGSILADVSLLMGLTRLALDQNWLDGSLPRELGPLWMLTDLQLQGNALQGDTYPFLERATGPGKVERACGVEVRLGHNKLTGSISDFVFSSCPSLLDLSHNQLSVPIPDPPQGHSQSSSLVPLSYLDLSSNKLTGSISDALVTGLTALSHSDLSDNLLSGSLPRSLADLPPPHPSGPLTQQAERLPACLLPGQAAPRLSPPLLQRFLRPPLLPPPLLLLLLLLLLRPT
ncbi:unnamed protein product, partial [Closterium sp. NIES-54]